MASMNLYSACCSTGRAPEAASHAHYLAIRGLTLQLCHVRPAHSLSHSHTLTHTHTSTQVQNCLLLLNERVASLEDQVLPDDDGKDDDGKDDDDDGDDDEEDGGDDRTTSRRGGSRGANKRTRR